jgi:hypothetical protein
MTKRASLFAAPAQAQEEAAPPAPLLQIVPAQPALKPEEKARRYPVARTREGKRVATVYLEREALRQLQKIAFDEETTIQELLVEAVNSVFAARGLSRIA